MTMADMLTIQEVRLYKMLIPLKEPFVISLGPILNAESVLVKITTEEGLTGRTHQSTAPFAERPLCAGARGCATGQRSRMPNVRPTQSARQA